MKEKETEDNAAAFMSSAHPVIDDDTTEGFVVPISNKNENDRHDTSAQQD